MSSVEETKGSPKVSPKGRTEDPRHLGSEIAELEATLSSLRSKVEKQTFQSQLSFLKLEKFVTEESAAIRSAVFEIRDRLGKDVDDLCNRIDMFRSSVKDHVSGTITSGSTSVPEGAGNPKHKLSSGAGSLGRKAGSAPRRKVFQYQESLLSILFQEDHWNSVYHMFESCFFLFMFSVVLQEYKTHGTIMEFELMKWAFGQVDVVFSSWLWLFSMSFLVVPLFCLWQHKYIIKPIYFAAYFCLQGYLFYYAYIAIMGNKLPIASALIVSLEQVRLSMKLHAFFIETYRMVTKTSTAPPEEAALDREVLKKPENVFENFFYFLWIPTLVYRNQYPMTSSIRWAVVAKYMVNIFSAILFVYIIFVNYAIPQFEPTVQNPGDLATLLMSIVQSTLPGMMLLLLIFYGVLHCWMNLGAELTRFADKRFYDDWWNSRSYSTYYRKWNVVVGDFIYAYMFQEFQYYGLSANSARLLSFLISAIIHEVIIYEAFGIFFPVSFILFAGWGVGFIYVTRLSKNSHFWNLFVWATLFLGNGILLVLYSREYYAHHQIPPLESSSWLPLSFQQLMR